MARSVALPMRVAITSRPDRTLVPLWPGSCRMRGMTSGGCESVRGGSRSADTMPNTNTSIDSRSGHCGAEPDGGQPERRDDRTGDRAEDDARAPASDSPRPSGSSRGTAALRATPYARDSTSMPNAAG